MKDRDIAERLHELTSARGRSEEAPVADQQPGRKQQEEHNDKVPEPDGQCVAIASPRHHKEECEVGKEFYPRKMEIQEEAQGRKEDESHVFRPGQFFARCEADIDRAQEIEREERPERDEQIEPRRMRGKKERTRRGQQEAARQREPAWNSTAALEPIGISEQEKRKDERNASTDLDERPAWKENRFRDAIERRIEPHRVGKNSVIAGNAGFRRIGVPKNSLADLRLELTHLPGLIAEPLRRVGDRGDEEASELHRQYHEQ